MTAAALCEDLALREDGTIVAANGDVSLRNLLRDRFAGLNADERERMMTGIAAAAPGMRTSQPLALRKSLLHVREALRERRPVSDDVKGQARGLRVDGLLRIDAKSFYVHGFVFDEDCELAELNLLAPDGSTIDLLERSSRHPHADADGFYTSAYRRRESGFIAFFTTAAEQLDEGWIVTMANREGAGLEARCPTAVGDRGAARQSILSHLRFDRDEKLLRAHIHPAIAVLQATRASAAAAHETYDIGQAPSDPATSIVIPLFARIDLIEHQLAAMVGDTDIRQAEVIYVLDSPELADELRAKLKQLSEEYRFPVRVVVMHESCGFAAAVNVGVAIARAAQILIMHSDVVPAAAGWLAEIGRAQRSAKAVATGALLLYHDDSVQNAGYQFVRDGAVEQPMKGLHHQSTDISKPHAVDAVSAACMLVEREAFKKAGGMSGCFVDGEFEDVDLCRRLVTRGGTIAWAQQARLYHLEGQSTPAKQRELAKPYNAWLTRQRWTQAKPPATGS